MKISCRYNVRDSEGKVKFTDIPRNIIGLDFLKDCLAEINNFYEGLLQEVLLHKENKTSQEEKQ